MKAGPNDQHRVILLAAIASAELFRAFLDETRDWPGDGHAQRRSGLPPLTGEVAGSVYLAGRRARRVIGARSRAYDAPLLRIESLKVVTTRGVMVAPGVQPEPSFGAGRTQPAPWLEFGDVLFAVPRAEPVSPIECLDRHGFTVSRRNKERTGRL